MSMSRIQFQSGNCHCQNLEDFWHSSAVRALAREFSLSCLSLRCPLCLARQYPQGLSVQRLLASDIADFGSLFQGTKLALTAWFLAIDLINPAKTGLLALALKRHQFDVCRDAKGNQFLDVAFNGQAHALITGDQDWRALKVFQGAPIVMAAEFLVM